MSEYLSFTEILLFLTFIYVCETECLSLMRRARETVRERISLAHRDMVVPGKCTCFCERKSFVHRNMIVPDMRISLFRHISLSHTHIIVIFAHAQSVVPYA